MAGQAEFWSPIDDNKICSHVASATMAVETRSGTDLTLPMEEYSYEWTTN